MKTLREYIDQLDTINEGVFDKVKNAVGWIQDLKGQTPSRSDILNPQPNDIPKSKVNTASEFNQQKFDGKEFSPQFIEWVNQQTGGNSDKFANVVYWLSHKFNWADPKSKDFSGDWITWTDWVIIFEWMNDAFDYIEKKYPDANQKDPKLITMAYTILGQKLYDGIKKSKSNELEEASDDAIKRIEELVKYK
jgi:hypothetical protein